MPLHNPESHTASGWMTRADELHRELEQVTRERDEAREDLRERASRESAVIADMEAAIHERNEARAELAKIAAGLNPDFVPRHLAAHPADMESVREGARDLLADNDRLTRELEEARAELHQWRTRRDHGVCEEERLAERARAVEAWREEAKRYAQNVRLRALLREAEWAGVADCQIGHGWARRCPWCGACEHCGHTLDCRFKAALERNSHD